MLEANSQLKTSLSMLPSSGRIGHVNLKVANLDRALAFYDGVLGLKITKQIGDTAAFLSFAEYHHDICLNTWHSRNGSAPAEGATGLFHLAILYSERADLMRAFQRLKSAGTVIDAAVDHGVSESLYFRDPDENGVELYWDRPSENRWSIDGELMMRHQPVDPEKLLGSIC